MILLGRSLMRESLRCQLWGTRELLRERGHRAHVPRLLSSRGSVWGHRFLGQRCVLSPTLPFAVRLGRRPISGYYDGESPLVCTDRTAFLDLEYIALFSRYCGRNRDRRE